MGHSTPNGAKCLRLGHDPSPNLKRICQVVTIYGIWQSRKNQLNILYGLHGLGEIALQS